MSSLRAAQEIGFFGYPDEVEDDSECPCGAPFGPWQEDRRLVGYPDQLMDTEVRPFRLCAAGCGEREEGQGWYE